MKLSVHSYNNDVFNSLLDGLKDDIVLKTANKKETPVVSGNDVFTSKDQGYFQHFDDEYLRKIASELEFAASKARVEINEADLQKFAHQATNESLNGKKLERAARKFCSELQRDIAPPQGVTRISEEMLAHVKHNSVLPANFPTEQRNNSKTGGYLGMSKNPNTIWDSGKLAEMSQLPENSLDRYGDEQIKTSKQSQKDFKDQQKQTFWDSIQKKMAELSASNPSQIANISTGKEAGTYQKLPTNSMSMFNSDRDFNNIPEKTAGETIKENAKERSEKSANAKQEWNKMSGSKKADNSMPFALSDETVSHNHTSIHRSAVDKLFEGLASLYENKNS